MIKSWASTSVWGTSCLYWIIKFTLYHVHCTLLQAQFFFKVAFGPPKAIHVNIVIMFEGITAQPLVPLVFEVITMAVETGLQFYSPEKPSYSPLRPMQSQLVVLMVHVISLIGHPFWWLTPLFMAQIGRISAATLRHETKKQSSLEGIYCCIALVVIVLAL